MLHAVAKSIPKCLVSSIGPLSRSTSTLAYCDSGRLHRYLHRRVHLCLQHTSRLSPPQTTPLQIHEHRVRDLVTQLLPGDHLLSLREGGLYAHQRPKICHRVGIIQGVGALGRRLGRQRWAMCLAGGQGQQEFRFRECFLPPRCVW